jgi:hypothetical protein
MLDLGGLSAPEARRAIHPSLHPSNMYVKMHCRANKSTSGKLFEFLQSGVLWGNIPGGNHTAVDYVSSGKVANHNYTVEMSSLTQMPKCMSQARLCYGSSRKGINMIGYKYGNNIKIVFFAQVSLHILPICCERRHIDIG